MHALHSRGPLPSRFLAEGRKSDKKLHAVDILSHTAGNQDEEAIHLRQVPLEQ